MKYDLNARWLYLNDDKLVSQRFAALLRTKYFRGSVLKPKSLKLPATSANVRKLIAPDKGLPPYSFDWSGRYREHTLQATASICPSGDQRFSSFVLVKLSLKKFCTDGAFINADDLRDLALACAKVGPSPVTFVEPTDGNHEAHRHVMRSTDTWSVPVSIEWITILHQSVVKNMAVDLMDAEAVPGVRVGRKGDYWWVILTPHPFRYSSPGDLAIQQDVIKLIDLPAIHSRFPTSSME